MGSRHATPLLDWSLLLLLLRARSRKSLCHWARVVGMHPHTLAKLSRGDVVSPGFDAGVRLLDACADWLTEEDWGRVRASFAPEFFGVSNATGPV